MNYLSSFLSIRFSAAIAVGLGCLPLSAIAQDMQAPSAKQVEAANQSVSDRLASHRGGNKAAATGANPYSIRQIGIRPYATYGYSTSDGLRARQGQATDTEIQTFSPGLAFQLGERWTADYSPTWRYYSDPSYRDTVDHEASLSGSGRIGTWQIGLNESYSFGSPSLAETGRQTSEESWSTSVSASHSFSNSLSYSISGSHSLRNVGGTVGANQLTDSNTYSVNNALRVSPSQNFNYGISVAYSKSDQQVGSDASSMSYTAQVGWNPSDKLSLDLDAGRSVRSFDLVGAKDLSSPTYSASLNYRAFEFTTLSLVASEGTSSSLFANQTSKSQQYSASISQRLLGRLNLNLSYSESDSSYLDQATGNSTSRSDTTESFDARLSTKVANKLSISAFYRDSSNQSDQTLFRFDTQQYGADISYRY